MTPQLGDFFVVRTRGWVAFAIRAVTRSPVNHAGVYVGNGLIVEGDPSGALLSHASNYPDAIWSHMDLPPATRKAIAAKARAKAQWKQRPDGTWQGVPYSWLDDLAIGLAHIFGRALPPVIRRRLSRPDRLMCSQLVDTCYLEAGVHLFNDGRLPGDVAPGDLFDLIKEQ